MNSRFGPVAAVLVALAVLLAPAALAPIGPDGALAAERGRRQAVAAATGPCEIPVQGGQPPIGTRCQNLLLPNASGVPTSPERPWTDCRFTSSTDGWAAGTTLTLQGDCTTSGTLVFWPENGTAPLDPFAVDGAGRAIFLREPDNGRFHGAGLLIRDATFGLGNLTIDGSRLGPGCSADAIPNGVLIGFSVAVVDNVTVRDMSRGTGEHCGSGIAVLGTPAVDLPPGSFRAVVQNSTVVDAGEGGIVLAEAGLMAVRGNSVEGGAYGIAVKAGSDRTLVSDNSVSEALFRGIAVVGCAGVQVTGNRVDGTTGAGPRYIGIQVQDAPNVAVSDNTVAVGISAPDGFSWTGISAYNAFGRVSGNTVTGGIWGLRMTGGRAAFVGNAVSVRDFGFWAENEGNATVTGNTFVGGLVGISFEGGTGRAQRNSLKGQSSRGIQVFAGARAAVVGNTLSTTARPFSPRLSIHGILFTDGGGGSVAKNRVTGYSNPSPRGVACGIFVTATAGQTRVGPNAFPGKGNEVNLCLTSGTGAGEKADQGEPITMQAPAEPIPQASPGQDLETHLGRMVDGRDRGGDEGRSGHGKQTRKAS